MPRGIPNPAGIVSRNCDQCGVLMFHYSTQIGTFCSRDCADVAKIQPMPERFWSKVEILGPNDCWLWTRPPCSDGYGKFWLDGKDQHPAHVALELKLGRPIRPGFCACHDCPAGDNPLCCNSTHLWEGTPGDNSRDMARKGRSARGDRHGSRTHPEVRPRGEKHHAAKLTADDVLRMRRMWDGSRDMARFFAAQHDMTLTPILFALTGKTWRHI